MDASQLVSRREKKGVEEINMAGSQSRSYAFPNKLAVKSNKKQKGGLE